MKIVLFILLLVNISICNVLKNQKLVETFNIKVIREESSPNPGFHFSVSFYLKVWERKDNGSKGDLLFDNRQATLSALNQHPKCIEYILAYMGEMERVEFECNAPYGFDATHEYRYKGIKKVGVNTIIDMMVYQFENYDKSLSE